MVACHLSCTTRVCLIPDLYQASHDLVVRGQVHLFDAFAAVETGSVLFVFVCCQRLGPTPTTISLSSRFLGPSSAQPG
jgi:hypothetical protein